MATFEYILVESKGAVGIVTLNRPKMLNALSFGVFKEIAAAIDDLEADDKIGCILITGSEKAFAAGADIKEMQPKTFIDMFSSDFTAVGGDTLIMFVTWDANGKLSSRSIHQFGSATLDKLSPHYADQTPLFVAMKTKPVLFTKKELEGHIEADYAPGERERAEQR